MSDRVANLERWKAKVAAMPSAAAKALDATAKQNAEEFADRLRTNVPKEHGDLAATILVKSDRPLSYTVSIGNAQVPYGPAVEWGHKDKGHHVPAHPYFFPLLRVIRKRLKGRMTRAVKQAVRSLCQESSG